MCKPVSVKHTCDLPKHGHMIAMTYAELDAGRLPDGCVYYVQLLPNGERYPVGGAGGVLVVRLDERME